MDYHNRNDANSSLDGLAPTSMPLDRQSTRGSRIVESAKHFPYWIFPLTAGFFWFGMLWAMIITWLAQGQPKYTSMSPTQHIAYISDVGADVLKPLFVTGSAIAGVCFFLSLCVMRLNQALVRRLERTLDVLSVLAGLLGAVCLILLSILDTRRHPRLHRLFLLLFMLGVVFSALFTTIEYRRLGKTFTQHPVLRWSYRFKIGIVVLEVLLSFAFGATMYGGKNNAAAVLEWLIAFVFTFYVLSFFFDLRPKARTKEDLKKETEDQQMREADGGRETFAAALGREHHDAGRQF